MFDYVVMTTFWMGVTGSIRFFSAGDYVSGIYLLALCVFMVAINRIDTKK